MKKKAAVIIAAVLVLLLAGGTIAVMNIDTSKKTKKTEKQETYTLLSYNASDLKSVTVDAADFSVTALNNGKSEWSIAGLDAGSADPQKAYNLAGTVSTVSSKNKYEKPADLSQYGLSNPSVTVTLETAGGEKKRLFIGDLSSVLGEYFIKAEGDDNVYTMYSYKVETLLKPLSYYREFNRLSLNTEDITEIGIKRGDENINIKIKDNIKQTSMNVWEMTSPYKSAANDDYIDNKILAAIENIKVITPAGVTVDAPVTLTITVKPYDDNTGKYSEPYTETLNVGSLDGKDYVVYKGEAYETPHESVEFVYDSAFNIVSKMQAMVDISLVDSVTVEYGGEAHTMTVKQDNGKYSFKLDGKDTDAKVSQGVYHALISLAADAVYNGREKGETLLKVSYKGKNSADNAVIEFNSIDDISCALTKNGKTEFTLKKSKINEFIDAFKLYAEENK